MNLRRSKGLVLLMLLPAVLSCAGIKSWIPSKAPATKAPADEVSRASRRTPPQAANLAQRRMAAGEYQKAIDVYHAAYQKHPQDQPLVQAYVKDIEEIASAADKAFAKQSFASAGKKYYLLQQNYSKFKGFEKKLAFNGTHLDERLDYCKKAIFKQGFQEYREGNLSEAIALWQDLLVIDPQNTDIQEALRTAKLQQKNLQGTD
jgi:tetratricopeptide (TPR) repeat protein